MPDVVSDRFVDLEVVQSQSRVFVVPDAVSDRFGELEVVQSQSWVFTMPDAVSDRFGIKAVVVLDATATDHLQIDFDINSARLYLLGGDLIARTIGGRMIFMARFKDAVGQQPAMLVSTVGGPTVKAMSLLERAVPLNSIVDLFRAPRKKPTDRPSEE